ncbi:biotin--[acetyl-CoA-carboxylase] ligase [Flagellimonas taeanensis]|uniref:biotin--[acetyl-CoA-carboxylase] ligase n=1 Tax=Flavobacteriaceae TaxID=49546 RepID=UPI000E67C2E8|nr:MULTISPECIES: biotin--[acetyl-CoA-carboxylase] ligase [Allomuricauda]MDC6384390.1 biotin--[acetyl-CoA-carboxylase] ligase [Muricauda sp. SK9]RIV49739.1 biotin--[acetyl-CoA-carboxylase] ligase [Allomuricauda taeanensis]RIV53938.1 biotin--[acetyl-CoA-carboxylase] ligase [Allomuricauda taeanensis]
MGEHTRIIKLDATDSTNVFLKELLQSSGPLEDYTTIVATKQLKGRGQMGSAWESEGGKNLTFSVLKCFDSLRAEQQFLLNIGVSLAVCDALEAYEIPNLKVKWPNDIMSGSFKICGILIENALKGQWVQHSIIGIGLNVNQERFENLDRAASLKSITGHFYDLDGLLNQILEKLQGHLDVMEGKTMAQLLPSYEKHLFRKDKPSTFTDADGELFMGFIRGVSSTGKLVVELEDRIFKEFDLKEVTLLY